MDDPRKLQKPSRRTRRRNPYYSGPVSDHFDGVRFFNPAGQPPNGLKNFLRWRFRTERDPWPRPASAAVGTARPAERVDDLAVTMVGHATMLIQIAGRNILTDPVWSERVSPLSFAGPRRFEAPGISFDDLPPIDLVLVSHNHYDHLDLPTLTRLHARHSAPVITPLGNDTLLTRAINGIDARGHDWGDRVEVAGLTVHVDPCHHWSARGAHDRRMALWASFTVDTPRGRVAFVGDTGFDDGRPYRALARHGPPRLAILPVGAYEPRWFMQAQHQNPEEAVEGFVTLGAEHAIGHHWDTFQLTNEPRDAPRQALAQALAQRGVPAERFRALKAAEVWTPPAT